MLYLLFSWKNLRASLENTGDCVLVSRTWLVEFDDISWKQRSVLLLVFATWLLTEFSQGHCWWNPTAYKERFVLVTFEEVTLILQVLLSRLWSRTCHLKLALVVFATLIPNVAREVCTCCFRDFDPERATWSLHVLVLPLWSRTWHVKFARVVFSTLILNVPREICTCCFRDYNPTGSLIDVYN